MKKSFTPTPKKQKYEFKANKRKFLVRGFTLIELLIVLAVLATVSITGIVSYTSYSQKKGFAADLLSINSVINRAYNLSLASDRSFPSGGGYGVYFNQNVTGVPVDPNQYMLFADNDNSHDYSSGDTIIEKFRLNRGVAFKYFTPSGDITNPNSNWTDIVFNLPSLDPNADAPRLPYYTQTWFCKSTATDSCRYCNLQALSRNSITIAIMLQNKQAYYKRVYIDLCTNTIRNEQ